MQASGGSWNYHRDEAEFGETMSMTAAGVGSLLLCKRQLEQFRQSRRGSNPLLTRDRPPELASRTTRSRPRWSRSTRRCGREWPGWRRTTRPADTNLIGQSIYYALYGLERVAAFADRQTHRQGGPAGEGTKLHPLSQKADGSWHALPQTDDMNTVWAILYLTKSTAKSIKRVNIKRLGAGTLVGGRYLPKDLTSMTVAGGRIMSRPMNGAVEGMLAVLEDPRAQNADAAVSGLIERFQREGPDALRPFKDRFRKMLSDRDPGMRQVAAWALARTGRSGRGSRPDHGAAGSRRECRGRRCAPVFSS